MPFELFAKSHPNEFAKNAHLFKQEGGNGGWGGFGQPGAREIIRRDEAQEIKADDDRGARVVILNITLTLCAFLGILLIGPLAAVLAVPGAIIMAAAIVYPRNDENLRVELWRLNQAQVIVISSAIILCMLWFFCVAQYWWLRIVDWYPFRVLLPWWIVCPMEAIILAAWYGFRDLREAHRRSLYNRNWPPTFQQMPADVGPYYAGEYPLDSDGYSEDDIKNAIKSALAENPNLIRTVPRPVGVYNKDTPNPNNGHFQDKMVDAAERAHPQEQPATRQETFKAPSGREVRWGDFVKFVWSGISIGISTPIWTRNGWSKTYVADLQESARSFGIAEYDGRGSANRLVISTKSDAAAELQRIHAALYPPAPLSQPSGDENGDTSEGRKVSEGRKEG